MQLLIQIKNLSVDRIDMDEAITAAAFAEIILKKYSELEVSPPDWLAEKHDELKRQVQLHYRDFVMRSVRQAEMNLDRFRSREENRKRAEDDVEKWKQKLVKLDQKTS